MSRALLFAPAIAASLALAACRGGEGDEAATETAGGGEASASGEMNAELSIVENVSADPALSTLADAVTAAGLVETLGGPGPYTVFAPTNAAFEASGIDLDAATVPELVSLLSYHIVPGVVASEDLAAAIEAEGGSVELATMTGATVTVSEGDDGLVVTDMAGNSAAITGADAPQVNGMVHVVDGVLRLQ